MLLTIVYESKLFPLPVLKEIYLLDNNCIGNLNYHLLAIIKFKFFGFSQSI